MSKEILHFELRDYQDLASASLLHGIHTGKDSLVVLPTGAGKTAVIANVCRSVTQEYTKTYSGGKRILVLSHVKEIVQQTYDFLEKFMWYEFEPGIYSAGLKRRDKDVQVLVAGIQSVYNKTAEIGQFDVIIIDEVHLLPPKGEGRYRTLIKDQRAINPRCTVCGLTATPYRMGGGYIFGKDRLFDQIDYEVKVSALINKGWLTRVTNKLGASKQDFDSIPLRNGEFDSKEVERLCSLQNSEVVADFIERTKNRKAVLVFASSILNSQLMGIELQKRGLPYREVYGETPQLIRDKTIKEFKEGKIKYLLNVGVLTTGFDAPNVDCIVLARPTASPGLYVQMVGRGLRLCEGKENCLILDYGGNIGRHGPIDDIYMRKRGRIDFKKDRPRLKLCKHCQTYNPIFAKTCCECGAEFGIDRANLSVPELKKAILFEEKPFRVAVQKIVFKRHISQKGNECLKVVYYCGDTYFQQFFFVDPRNPFYPRFVAMWASLLKESDYAESDESEYEIEDRGIGYFPKSLSEALERIRNGELDDCYEIRVSYQRGSKFPKIDGWKKVLRDDDGKLATWNGEDISREKPINMEHEYKKEDDGQFGWEYSENPYWNKDRDEPTTPYWKFLQGRKTNSN